MPTKNYDNTLIGQYIRAIENPDCLGYRNGKWYASPYDRNARGFGVDIVENDAAARVTSGRRGGYLTEAEPGSSIPLVGPLVDAANKYVRELEWRAKNDPASIALQGKYTMPAIAAASLLPLAGEAFAGTQIAGLPATTWADTAVKAAFAGHGLNHWINEGIDGMGDAAMTALELAPLGELARPMYQAGKGIFSGVRTAAPAEKGLAAKTVAPAKKALSEMTNEELNAAYRAAYKNGDVVEGQRLWDYWFNKKAPNNKAVTSEGRPIESYHTVQDKHDPNFTVFDTNIEGNNSAIYAADDSLMSGTYTNKVVSEEERQALAEIMRQNELKNIEEGMVGGGLADLRKAILSDPERGREWIIKNTFLNQEAEPARQKRLYIKLDNPVIMDNRGHNWNNIQLNELPEDVREAIKPADFWGNNYTTRSLEEAQKATGHDGAIIRNVVDYGASEKSQVLPRDPATVFEVNDPNNVKLADPFTFDDNGNLIDLTERADFTKPDNRYGWIRGKEPKGTFVEDFTDFNTMVERMNSKVDYEGMNPFSDGKMTGFRKWALDNGASPKKILEIENKYSKDNWSALREYKKVDRDASAGGKGFVQMYKNTPNFNQTFPHEVEHRLLAELFGEERASITVEEATKAFKDGIWKIPKGDGSGEMYFQEHNFEELLPRFTQIKNALGIKEFRALTETELRKAYQMFKNGSKKIADNNMKEFFENIKDWKAAAKLSGKALGISGVGYSAINYADNGKEVRDYK